MLITLLLTAAIATATTRRKSKTTPLIVRDQYGNTLNVTAQTGKIVFLNFWALSCIPCKAEMPTISWLRTHCRADTNILIIPIDLDNNPASLTYIDSNHLDLPIYTAAGAVPQTIFHGMLPTTVIINRYGKVIYFHEGEADYSTPQFTAFIDSLAKQ